MKVLFAVNDENVSTSIVKKYQKKYKEIISYKNVYYFNAILKELQRNKSYDRIVIGEDLEEFSSSSYSQKDNFIFDKLDGISDEAVSTNGNDIPIILICSDRRTKSEEILTKIFGISIYNAIIGEDRSIDEVCRLINKPRSKKEAKAYYQIDTTNVNYENYNENDVSEIEIQNILKHFKRLGTNENKYVESFNNIVSQYNTEQMKLIIAILPENVKEILEANSDQYRKLASKNGKEVKKQSKSSATKKGTSETFLNTNNKTMKLSKPIVVPSTIDKSLYKKVEPKKKIEIEEIEDNDVISENLQEKPKRRGRPRKNIIPEENIEDTLSEKTKRRGRPRKNIDQENNESPIDDILPGIYQDDNDEYMNNYNDNNKLEEIKLPGFDEDEEDDYEDIDNENKKYKFESSEDSEENDDDNEDTIVDEDYDDSDDEDEEDNDNNEEDARNDNYEDDSYKERKYDRNEISNRKNSIEELDSRKNSGYANNGRILFNSSVQRKYDNEFDDEKFASILASQDKKLISFVGTSKNGTSFIINNVAKVLSENGVDTAIFDATRNKSSYYIYTKNDEELRKIAVDCLDNLKNERAEGIKAGRCLTVYTNIPTQNEEIKNTRPILETLINTHSVVLVDCDFETPVDYFAKSQDIYLIQSMDVLSIQPLTAFLRELKEEDALDEKKIKIILNKMIKIRGITSKNIIGGMSNYNDPEMAFMTELFDRNLVHVSAQIPFDEDVYAQYLESLVECDIKNKNYPKEFKQKINGIAEEIWPSLSASKKNKKNKREFNKEIPQYSNSFSTGMNNTLDNMRKRY